MNYSLGGSPTSPPEHVYKITARKSPLPPTPSNDLQLVSVYVDGARVLTNQTVQCGADAFDGLVIGKRGGPNPYGQSRSIGGKYVCA